MLRPFFALFNEAGDGGGGGGGGGSSATLLGGGGGWCKPLTKEGEE